MQERHLIQICILITIIGLFVFIIFYEEEFKEKTISEMHSTIGSKGIVIGRVDYILREEPLIFILQNEEKIKVFYSKKFEIQVGDKVEVYGETTQYNNEIELLALKVIKK